jgi:hypothetical protein
VQLEGFLVRTGLLSPETLEALICAKDWLIGFNDEEEGEPMTGQRMFGSDDDYEEDYQI